MTHKRLGPLNVNQLIKQLEYYRDKHQVLEVEIFYDGVIKDQGVVKVRNVNYNPVKNTIEIYGE